MRVRIWGCRGSLATPGPQTVRVGGNTSCVEVRGTDGRVLVLDAGTGVRPLGLKLQAERHARIDLLLTHFHLDHIEGLGFFAPLFDSECDLHIWGPAWEERSLRDRVASYVSPPLFPVPFDRIPGKFTFHEIWREEWELGGVRVRCEPVVHPGPTLAYRLEEHDRSFAFIPDNEPALETDLSSPNGDVSGLAIARGADLLFHDAQYTADEYRTRVGWGHSALPDFARFVQLAEPRQVLMFHHDPAHGDEMVDEMLHEARELSGRADLDIGREGFEADLR